MQLKKDKDAAECPDIHLVPCELIVRESSRVL